MRTKIALLALSLATIAGCGSAEAPAQTRAQPQAGAKATGWVARVERTPEGGYRMGNPAAPIRLVEYGARTCPSCQRFAEQGVPTLKARYVASGKVSYEFRDFLVHGAPDLAAALLGQCVPKEAFFTVLEENYAAQKRAISGIQSISAGEQAAMKGQPVGRVLELLASRGGYLTNIQRHGVPLARAKACLVDQKAMDQLVRVTDKTSTDLVPGTPTFLINGKRVGGTGWADVERALRAAGA